MLLRVLGPIEIAGASGPVPIATPKLRALLAVLAIHRGVVSSADGLIDALWGESPPRSAQKLLQVYVSHLRKLLPTGLGITTGTNGYALAVASEAFDAAVFERLVEEGREALRDDNPALAASLLHRALGLWRGPAYADVRYDDLAVVEADRLELLRSMAMVDRADAELRLGRHADVLPDLRSRLAEDPTDERLAALTLRAAYVAAGPTEALTIYEQVRAALGDELGAEPGHDLRELRARIVRGDRSLERPAPKVPADDTPALPVPPNPLIGRDADVAELRSMLARPTVRLVTLTGAGGSGKSRLALEVSRALAGSYANGIVLVELASLADPELVMPTIARAFGLEPGADAFATLSSSLASRETLLVLDNLEHLRSAAPRMVRLLGVAPRLVILATSRVVLHLSGEHVFPVAPLSEDDAVELFAQRARAHDPSFALDTTTRSSVVSICRRLDGLPLPIELAAARVRPLGLQGLDDRLASRLTVLTGGPRDLPARQQTLRETLAWSANLLDAREADALARLSVFAGPFPMDGARTVAGADDEVLAALVDHNLVQVVDIDGERRFRLLETVREYAYELLGDDRESAELALIGWISEVVAAADLDRPGDSQVAKLARVDAVLDSLRDALRHAAREPDPTWELALASGVWRYWLMRGHLAEGRAVLDGMLDRRGLVDTVDGVRAARGAASLAWSLGDVERGTSLGEAVLAAAIRVGEPVELMHAHNMLGVFAGRDGDAVASERHHREAIRIGTSLGELDLTDRSKANLAVTYLAAGRLGEARSLLHEVLERRRSGGVSEGLGFVHLNIADVEYAAGDLTAAESHYLEAIRSFSAVGFGARVAAAYHGLAAIEARTGRADSAARRLGMAATLLGEVGWGGDGTELAPVAIDAARQVLGDATFESLFMEGVAAGQAQATPSRNGS